MRLAKFNNFIHAFDLRDRLVLGAVEVVLRHEGQSGDGGFHGLVPHCDVDLVPGIAVLSKRNLL